MLELNLVNLWVTTVNPRVSGSIGQENDQSLLNVMLFLTKMTYKIWVAQLQFWLVYCLRGRKRLRRSSNTL